MHYYFKFALPVFTVACAKRTSVLRIVAHLCIVTPYMQIVFIMSQGALQTMSWQGGVAKFKEKGRQAIKYAYRYWPFFIVLMYTARIPIRYGNLLFDCAGFVWGVILSWLANQGCIKR